LRPQRSLSKLSAHDGELHLVHAHGVGFAGKNPMERHIQFWDRWRIILEQGIHIHAYTSYKNLSDPRMSEYHKLSQDFPNFHLEKSVEYDELLLLLTQYDYALAHQNNEDSPLRREFWYHLSNNFFTYLDAGLPIITSPTVLAYAHYVSTLKIGVVVSDEELKSLKSILERQNLSLLINNVKLARSKFELDHHKFWNFVMGSTQQSDNFV
jgi:hypothetical protein